MEDPVYQLLGLIKSAEIELHAAALKITEGDRDAALKCLEGVMVDIKDAIDMLGQSNGLAPSD
jgi:hypothetical protein